jgi:putative flippase GtrA
MGVTVSRSEQLLAKLTSPEVATFLAVGATGYVVDVSAFNVLRSQPFLSTADPSYARIVAVALAMVVTYFGNRLFTWRDRQSGDRRREIGLFVVFNLIGLGLSVATLVLSHDLLGLTSRLADNISANVVGLALGTLFRYWSYQRFVFGTGAAVRPSRAATPAPAQPSVDEANTRQCVTRTRQPDHDWPDRGCVDRPQLDLGRGCSRTLHGPGRQARTPLTSRPAGTPDQVAVRLVVRR